MNHFGTPTVLPAKGTRKGVPFMHRQSSRLRKPSAVVALLVVLLAYSQPHQARAQTEDPLETQSQVLVPPEVQRERPVVGEMVKPHIFAGDMRLLPAAKPGPMVPGKLRPQGLTEDTRLSRTTITPDAAYKAGDVSIASVTPPAFLNPAPNFDGIGYTAFVPPDPVGDVGSNHYIHMVNSQFQIFDKAGTSLAGPFNINQLWINANAGGLCQANNNGDPYVVYDHLADRWLISQFAVPNGFGTPPTAQCIAISRTADPVTGGWYLYEFTFNFAHDYPKIALWPDGYYMASQRGFSGGALNAVVFDRANMLNGNPATFQAFTSPSPAIMWLPSDLDGPAPPVGTPNFFTRQVDGDLWGGADRIDIMAFTVDWGNPANSSFTALPSLPVAPFSSDICAGTNLFNNCVPQPNTTVQLETLPHWPMGPQQYRNFGTYETMVFNHTVDVDGMGHSGVRWYELRRAPGGAWTLFQQGTFSPDGGDAGFADDPHRWMGSIAMDKAGNIALGYSASSDTVFPEIRYAGRLATDPAGLLPHGEVTLVAGGNSQIVNGTRWGDYSAMRVDPTDGCTFWYTTQYIAGGEPFGAGNGGAWATRIGAFRFNACNQADLSISKSDIPDPVTAGETLTYTISVRNNGPDTATGVVVTDTLPAGVIYNADSGGCVQAPPGTLTCSLGTLLSGQTRSFAIQVTVSATLVSATGGFTTLTNTATVTADQDDPNLLNNAATATTIVNDRADLRLTKLCKPDGETTAGGNAVCTILVDNLGPSAARNVMVTDAHFSSGPFTINSATISPPALSPCFIFGGIVQCNVGTVPAGGRTTVTVNLTSAGQVDVNNVATVTSSTPDPNMANNIGQGSARFTGAADLAITKSDTPDPVVAGTTLSYTLTVTNHGPSTAQNVAVTDVLPAQVDVLSVTPSQGSCNAGIPGNPLHPLTCNLGSMSVGTNATITIVVKVHPGTPNGTVIHNDARVRSDYFDPNNGNNLATAPTTVLAQADLAVSKTSDADAYKPSTTIAYTVTVVNNGPSDALAAVVTDQLPTTMQAIYLSDTGACTIAGLTLTCSLGDIPVGQTRSFNIYLTVRGARGLVTNTAIVSSGTADPDPGNNTVTRDVTIQGNP